MEAPAAFEGYFGTWLPPRKLLPGATLVGARDGGAGRVGELLLDVHLALRALYSAFSFSSFLRWQNLFLLCGKSKMNK